METMRIIKNLLRFIENGGARSWSKEKIKAYHIHDVNVDTLFFITKYREKVLYGRIRTRCERNNQYFMSI